MKWVMPKIWEDGTCWIIGGGSSLIKQFNIPKNVVDDVRSGKSNISAYSPYMKFLHDKHVIGINGAFRLGDWIDICFFGDKSWYFQNRKDLKNFSGLIIGCPNFLQGAGWKEENVLYLQKEQRSYGISTNPSKVCWNRNSGSAAISVAVHAGCKRIVLVGFDMKLIQGVGHWHNLYNGKTTMPFDRHLVGFSTIAKDAERLGIEIINLSKESKIDCFPKMSLKEFLKNESQGATEFLQECSENVSDTV